MAEAFWRNMMRIFLIACFLPLFLAAAQAGNETPDGIVKALYAQHIALINSGQPGVLADKTLREKFLNADMAERIESAAVAPEFDPILDAQDSDVKRVSVHLLTTGYETAEVEVEFKNLGDSKRLVYSLIREFGAWRIRNIVSPQNEWNLQDLYHGP
ncbi:MAG: hypothetical protein V4691_02385 [Pseudomonadota bacterium]